MQPVGGRVAVQLTGCDHLYELNASLSPDCQTLAIAANQDLYVIDLAAAGLQP